MWKSNTKAHKHINTIKEKLKLICATTFSISRGRKITIQSEKKSA
uniref:Uncharacterized protein n=1 Tax=Rhizophora mucronata TaxID=61149 RepID=A0A2P2QVX5_RHIMU